MSEDNNTNVLVVKFKYTTVAELDEAKRMFENSPIPNLVSVEKDAEEI